MEPFHLPSVPEVRQPFTSSLICCSSLTKLIMWPGNVDILKTNVKKCNNFRGPFDLLILKCDILTYLERRTPDHHDNGSDVGPGWGTGE